MAGKLYNEKETLEKMLRIYCRGSHGGGPLCPDCRSLLDDIAAKVAACPQSPKPACRNCRIHCFPAELRARVRAVMRYSGPRMALRHPLLTLRHYLGF